MSTTAAGVGLFASIFLVTGMLPQIIKVYKMKEASEISYGWLFFGSLGNILWVVYGLIQNDIVILLANIFMTINFLVLICLKLKYK